MDERRVEAFGTELYRAAFAVGALLNRVEAEPEAVARLAEAEPNALDELYLSGERLMAALKTCGLRLNRRGMGDAQDQMGGE